MLTRLYAVSSGPFVLISRVSTASDSHLSLHCQTTCRASACWDFFSLFSVVCFFFQYFFFSKISFMNTIRVPNILDPDQDQHFVRLDQDPNSLQRFSAEDANS